MPPETPSSAPPATPQDSWRQLARFMPYLWPRDNPGLKVRIILSCLLIGASMKVSMTLPFLLQYAIDGMHIQGHAAYVLALGWVLAYAAGRFGTVIFDNLRNIVFERVGQDATRRLAEDVFTRLHALSMRFHLARRTGEVTVVMERGTKSIDTMLYFMLFNVVPTVVQLVWVEEIFYRYFGWGLVAATALAVAIYLMATRLITEWRSHLRAKMNKLDGQAMARAVDSLLNYETVKYFGAEPREQARYAAATRAYADAAVTSENSLGLLNIAQALIVNLLMAAAMGYTVWGWSRGVYTIGQLVFVQTFLTQLFRPLDMLGMVYRTIRQGLTDMAAMFALIDTDIEVKDAPGAPALIVRQPSVVFDNVVFGYDRDREILHGLSFEVPAGHHVALVGPSGAGKSTIARLIFRFYDPWGGRILIDGQDIAGVTQASLRSALGIVPQDSVLFNDTIGYNVGYGREGATEAEIEAAARGAAIWPLIERLPKGLGTEVGERGLKLSGGEKQRVAIARTLLKNPPILLLDEATSALDTRTEQEIIATLHDLSAQRTSLTIAHRLSTIADADTILVLNEGRLAESGNHADLLRRDGLYAAMWAAQANEAEQMADAAE